MTRQSSFLQWRVCPVQCRGTLGVRDAYTPIKTPLTAPGFETIEKKNKEIAAKSHIPAGQMAAALMQESASVIKSLTGTKQRHHCGFAGS